MGEEIEEGVEQEAGLAEEEEGEVDVCKCCDYFTDCSFVLQAVFMNLHEMLTYSEAHSYIATCVPWCYPRGTLLKHSRSLRAEYRQLKYPAVTSMLVSLVKYAVKLTE